MSARRQPTVRRSSSLPVWASLSLLLAACAAEAVPSQGPATTASSPPPPPVLLVGDSVLALVADDLAGRLDAPVHVDAVDCRELADATDGGCGSVPAGTTVPSGIEAIASSVEDLAAEGVVPSAAVLVLANNSSMTASDLDAAMAAADGIDRVWWVNARIDGFGRQDVNNRLLDELADRDPRAGVVDWFGASSGRAWLSDHVHPDETGQRRLARLIADHLACDCRP